jgi:hypothetical protein
VSAEVLQFVRAQIAEEQPRRLDKRKLDAAYAALHEKFTEVMITYAADDVGVLALIRFTADVLAEVSAHKLDGAQHLELLLTTLCRRAYQ